jgi:quercetin dioxygenase-like cupin family protein
MTPPAATTAGFVTGPDQGEALWFRGALVLLKATAQQTQGRYAVTEWRAPKGLAAPLHVHANDDELFLVLDGEVRFQLGEEVVQGTAGSVAYGPRGVAHSFHVDSERAHLLLVFGPGGTEGLFREGGNPARAPALPPADEEYLDAAALAAIGERYGQTIVGPPLLPRA